MGAAWTFVTVASIPALQVTPASNITAIGNQGGPFSPTSFQYQLSSSFGSLNYAISGIPTWLNADIPSGTATTTPVIVTFSLFTAGSVPAGVHTGTISFTNTDSTHGNTTRTATLSVSGSLIATPASGPAPLNVTFQTPVQSGDTNVYTLNFTLFDSAAMSVRPTGIACTTTPPCYTGIASASYTYTSPGSYVATLLNTAGDAVASIPIVVSGAAPRVSQLHRWPLYTHQSSGDQVPQRRGPPLAQPRVALPTLTR
jgi:hypothetical protein